MFDLSDFHDTVVLGDGSIFVHSESGASVKVSGSVTANRNPCATRLKPLTPLQLSRLIRRLERKDRDYQLLHPGEKFCSACNAYHPIRDFTLNRSQPDGRHWRCTTAERRYQRLRYAEKQRQQGREVRYYRTSSAIA